MFSVTVTVLPELVMELPRPLIVHWLLLAD